MYCVRTKYQKKILGSIEGSIELSGDCEAVKVRIQVFARGTKRNQYSEKVFGWKPQGSQKRGMLRKLTLIERSCFGFKSRLKIEYAIRFMSYVHTGSNNRDKDWSKPYKMKMTVSMRQS